MNPIKGVPKVPTFKVGDTVAYVVRRSFTIASIGSYYGEPLYFSVTDDTGVPESELELVREAK